MGDRAVWYFFTAHIIDSYAHAASPGRAAWKCMRERRASVRYFKSWPQRSVRAVWYFLPCC